ncbi:hypothetical protein SRCM100623_01914 [Acetobacter pasteurianus]|uniref:Uncharacterized protein n=1 Tax=Acetobacter pasteurianus TaxID=438 RepID=A0A1A0DAK0_ACEPA|nr:hypothetical protein SRCM100623_01914 [Acetobacter pasteurianus]
MRSFPSFCCGLLSDIWANDATRSVSYAAFACRQTSRSDGMWFNVSRKNASIETKQAAECGLFATGV